VLPILASFQIGGVTLTVHAYGAFLVLAALAGGTLFVRGVAGMVRSGGAAGGGSLGRAAAAGLYLAALAAGLAGARALDAIMNVARYRSDPWLLVSTDPVGFALYGGMAGAGLVVWTVTRRLGVPIPELADRSLPAVVAGLVLLRLGCFLNGCCEGIATSLPWGVAFPPRAAGLEGDLLRGALPLFGTVAHPVPVHPTALYEALAAVILLVFVRRLGRRGHAPGVTALAWTAGFLLFRAANQAIRPASSSAVLSAGQLSLAYLAVGLVVVAVTVAVARAARRRSGVTGAAGTASGSGLGRPRPT
jgi:phosphatidylglycerol:prolipoprotein diacylglycerol transferase